MEQVYDVTKFLEDHPGGDEVLLAATGLKQWQSLSNTKYLRKPVDAPDVIYGPNMIHDLQERMQVMILRMLGTAPLLEQ